MSYNAAIAGTLSNKAYAPAQAVPTDARSYYYDNVNFVLRPYVSTTEVRDHLNTPSKRTGHFPIIINTGGTLVDGVITGGTNVEWWFKDGVADGDLVEKTGSGGGGGGSTIIEYDF